jgi:glycosyltransferase involved in cell wall biosynthesis
MIPKRAFMLSIIVPFYNEEETVSLFFDAITPVMKALKMPYEILCIDDGSHDQTLPKLKEIAQQREGIRVVSFSRNFGKEVALAAGFDHARGDAIIIIDSDLQDPPAVIPELVATWQQGYDVVYGIRKKRDGDSFFKRLTAGWFYKLYNKLGSIHIPENAGDFRLLDRKVVNVLKQIPERTRFTKGLYSWAGFRQTGIYFDRPERVAGTTKWNFWKLWNFALDGITSFSTVPLRIWLYVGIAVSALGFGYGAFLVTKTLIEGVDVPGYASLMVAILFFGGLQMMTLGVIGEYLGRIYKEVKGRPLYIVKEEAASKKQPK